jgi:hypothetical protein
MTEEWPILKKRLNKFHHTVQNEIIPNLIHDKKIGPHPEGLALYNHRKKLCYVLMPKNCTTTIVLTTMFYTTKPEWRFCNFLKETNLEIEKFAVVLRDPVKRFISATNMFLTMGSPMAKTFVLKGKLHTNDCHYSQQAKFIARVPKDKTDFFYYNKNILSDISSYYDLGFNTNHHHNASQNLVTSVDEDFIKTLYAEDYELINSVKFVNMP